MGLPNDWEYVEYWLRSDGTITFDAIDPSKVFATKWPDLPVLKDYSLRPDESF
jgi:hypothetical protein